jgi:hypothetical protein
VSRPEVVGQAVILGLFLVFVWLYGHTKIEETKARFGDEGLRVPPDNWWRESNVQAMRSDDRVRRWLKAGLWLLLVGVSLDGLGLLSSDRGVIQSVLIASGLACLTAGLVTLVRWTQLLRHQLFLQRSESAGYP